MNSFYNFKDYEALFDLIDYSRVYPKVYAKIIRHYKVENIEGLYRICKGKYPKKDNVITSNIDYHIGRALDLLLYPKDEMIFPVARFYGERLKRYLQSKGVIAHFTKGLLRGDLTLTSVDLVVKIDSLNRLKEILEGFYLFGKIKEERENLLRFESLRGHCFNLYGFTHSNATMALFLLSFPEESLNYLRKIFPHYTFSFEGIRAGDRVYTFEREEDIFRFLNMQFIPYELRWDREAIDKALDYAIPPLIEVTDVKGDFHIHTLFSDGEDFIEDIVREARDLDYEYIGITEHSRSQKSGNGIDVDDWSLEADFIQSKNKDLFPFRILKGLEVDILKDGGLDFPYNILKKMDIVILALHHPNDGKLDPNEKIAYGMKSEIGSILAHPKDRYWGREPLFELDIPYLFENALNYNMALEISSIPDRIGFSAEEIKMGKQKGVRFAINSDAHAPGYLKNIDIGIIRARRGWLTKEDVINTYTYDRLKDEGLILRGRKI